MKRLITFISLILIIVVGYTLITKGFENDKLTISSYNTIEDKSEALTKKLASYNKRNQDDYEKTKSSLDSSIKSYENSKEKYEAIVEELADVLNPQENEEGSEQPKEEIIYSDKEKYRMDFVLVILGDYSRKENVDVDFKLSTSPTIDTNSSVYNYFLADLEFSVTGEYMNVSKFISDLENDEKLQWQISNFSMAQVV